MSNNSLNGTVPIFPSVISLMLFDNYLTDITFDNCDYTVVNVTNMTRFNFIKYAKSFGITNIHAPMLHHLAISAQIFCFLFLCFFCVVFSDCFFFRCFFFFQ